MSFKKMKINVNKPFFLLILMPNHGKKSFSLALSLTFFLTCNFFSDHQIPFHWGSTRFLYFKFSFVMNWFFILDLLFFFVLNCAWCVWSICVTMHVGLEDWIGGVFDENYLQLQMGYDCGSALWRKKPIAILVTWGIGRK